MSDNKLNLVLLTAAEKLGTQLVGVKFPGCETEFQYKAPISLGFQPGDFAVIANTKKPGAYLVAEVVTVSPLSSADLSGEIRYVWVVDKVNLTQYQEISAAEAKIKSMLEQAIAKKEREAAMALLEQEFGQELLGTAVNLLVAPGKKVRPRHENFAKAGLTEYPSFEEVEAQYLSQSKELGVEFSHLVPQVILANIALYQEHAAHIMRMYAYGPAVSELLSFWRGEIV